MHISRRGVLSLAALPAALAAGERAGHAAARPTGRTATVTTLSLDGLWKFRTDPYSVGEDEHWFAPSFDAAHWKDMAVPGVWDVVNEHSDYVGSAWYRTEFATDPAWAGRLVRLIFDGVYNDAVVWLNGQRLGVNDIGYLPFHFDIGNLASPGQLNQLTVKADNRYKTGAVWNWGGIRRPVSIEVTAPIRLETIKIVAEPDLATGAATVEVRARAVNHAASHAGVRPGARLTIRKDGAVIWQSAIQGGGSAGRNGLDFLFKTALTPQQVRLWHFNAPHLYEAEVTLLRGETAIHALACRFGIRKVEIAGERLLLNGEPIRTVGFNVVAEDRHTGSALPPSRIKADVDRLKMLGANMARLSHQPLPSDYLDYLDEVGILVVDEVPIWGKSDLVDARSKIAADWLQRLIDAHHNHPSVIGWSVGNEIGRLDRNAGVKDYVRSAVARAKALDPTRLAVYTSNTASHEADDPVQYCDMILLNAYNNMAQAIEGTHKLHPGKPIFMSEYGGVVDSEDPDQATVDGDAFLNEMRGKAHVVGASLWTLNDYRSSWPGWPHSPATPASQNRSWGVLTSDRRPKRSYFSYRIAHAPVHMRLHRSGRAWSVVVTPRGVLDLPAYAVDGYHLLWQVANEAGDPVAAGLLDLPPLSPGGAAMTLSLPEMRAGACVLVDLIDPAGYSLLTVKEDLVPPATPAIRRILSSAKSLRVMFDPVARADAYVLIHSSADGEARTRPTIDDFVELDGLELDRDYELRLVAVNAAGESRSTPIVRARTDRNELPPIIWSVQSADKALFVNYTTEATDLLYEIELRPPDGGTPRTISVTTRGTTRIPGLENGRPYQVRMRRRNALGFPPSPWSEPLLATPRGAGDLPAPAGGYMVAAASDSTMLVFDPVEGAAGYRLRLGDRVVAINSSASGTVFVRVDGAPKTASLAAVDDYGAIGRALEIRSIG